MKPLLALLLAATCTMSQARPPSTIEPPILPDRSQCQTASSPEQARMEAMKDEVRAGTAVPDHRVTLDGFDFDVYVDSSFNPPVVVLWQPLESMNRLLTLPSIRKQKYLLRKLKVVTANYARSMRGEPPEPVPADDTTANADDEGEPGVTNIFDCIPFYPAPDRGMLFSFGDGGGLHQVRIDATYGRPEWANFRRETAPVTAARDKKCQKDVASWGKPGQDQGGHAIGSRLGGWGGRANMTPQDATLNMSNEWKSLDAAADACASRDYLTDHTVMINYDGIGVRPKSYTVQTYVVSNTCPPKIMVVEKTDVGNYLPLPSELMAMTLHSNSIKRVCGG